MNELPPLPKAHALYGRDLESLHVLYTSGQMDAYGRACERAAYERAKRECEIVKGCYQHDEGVWIAYRCFQRISALGVDK